MCNVTFQKLILLMNPIVIQKNQNVDISTHGVSYKSTIWSLQQDDHMESPTRCPYEVSNKTTIWSLQQDDHMGSPTRRSYGVSNMSTIWSLQQDDHIGSPTRRPHWVSHKKECQVLQHFKADEFFPIHRRGEIEQNASKIFN